jgi:flagellar hook-length control protein FliK
MSLIDFTSAAKAPPPAPRPGRDRTGPPPDAFASLLDDHQARTATAEGLPPKDTAGARAVTRGDRRPPRDLDRDGNTGDGAPRPAPATPDQATVAAAAAATPSDRQARPAPTDAAGAAHDAVVASTAGLGGAATIAPTAKDVGEQALAGAGIPAARPGSGPGASPGLSATSAPGLDVPASEDAAGAGGAEVPLPLVPARDPAAPPSGLPAGAPVASPAAQLVRAATRADRASEAGAAQLGQDDPGTPTHVQPSTGTHVHASATSNGSGAGASSNGAPGDSLPDPARQGSPAALPAQHATGATATAPELTAPIAATPTPTSLPSAGQPPTGSVTPSAGSALPAPAGTAVPLARAAETVQLALRAASERGVTRARISLSPAELGSIEIHLRHTSDGLVARVVAEHAGAAHLLQQAGAELRRSLEAQGVTLLRLDVGASGQQAGQQQGSGAPGGQSGTGSAGSDGRHGANGSDPDAQRTGDDATAGPTHLTLPNGVLVDVLA